MVYRRLSPVILAAIVILLGFSSWILLPAHRFPLPPTFNGLKDYIHLPCWSLPGANDTLVVLRTGATELLDKLPAHLDTSTRCFTNYVIYSDYEEAYNGQLITNTLESVSQNIRDEHPDFELYRQLQQYGRAALRDGAYDGTDSAVDGKGIPTGNTQNPGWRLDKWKFLPMMNRTLHDYPDLKWYVFTEADNYLVWSTVLQYLSRFDPNKPIYAGQSMAAGDGRFIYGGAGIIVSQPALQAVVAYYSDHKHELEELTDNKWAGDDVLGKAFADAGVRFKDIWPYMQGDYPGWLTYLPLNGRSMEDGIAEAWCLPVGTFHHVTPDAVRDMWHAEQKWIGRQINHADRFMRQRDVFDIYTLPQMTQSPRADWDSDCDQFQAEANSEEACEQACRERLSCVQFSFEEGIGRCKTRETPRLGVAKSGFRSTWFRDRMEHFRERMPRCDNGVKWPT